MISTLVHGKRIKKKVEIKIEIKKKWLAKLYAFLRHLCAYATLLEILFQLIPAYQGWNN